MLVQQCSQLGGILSGAFLLHHLLLLPLLSCLLLVLLNLVEDELHHLVAHDHSEDGGQQGAIFGKSFISGYMGTKSGWKYSE